MVKGPLKGKSEDVHCAFLLLWLGETGRDIFSTWNLAPGEVDKLDGYLAKFKAHIEPIANPMGSCHQIFWVYSLIELDELILVVFFISFLLQVY